MTQKNEELQEQLTYLNKVNNYSLTIAEIIREKRDLTKENLDLKNELLILKYQINENVNENETSYNMIDNEANNNNNGSEGNKVKALEKELEKMNKMNKINANELEKIQKENEKILSILQSKENELSKLQKNISGSGENNKNTSNNVLNSAELSEENEELKKEIQEKKLQIEQLENEINNIKIINNQIIQENNKLKEKIQILDNDAGHLAQEDRLSITLDNLREELKDKNLQIEKLIKENKNLKNNIKKNNNNNVIINGEDDKEINGLKNKDENDIRKTVNSMDLNYEDKINLYKSEIKQLKNINESDMIQIKTLKADIKEMKEKIKKMETFSGQLKNYDEFISLLSKALYDYYPKKKEQKEALTKLVEVINNHKL
jgi:hypothetical protein